MHAHRSIYVAYLGDNEYGLESILSYLRKTAGPTKRTLNWTIHNSRNMALLDFVSLLTSEKVQYPNI